jgi:hypothetical protein
MVAYNFKPRFAPAVQRGTKSQTIRPPGKRRHAKPGDMLQLYTNMRSPDCRLLRVAPCILSTGCSIFAHMVVIDGRRITGRALEDFASADGFSSWGEMCEWFRDAYGLPFEGRLIRWDADYQQQRVKDAKHER